MSWLSMLAQPAPLLIGFAAVTFILAGISFLGWNVAVARDRVSRRVDVLCPIRTVPVVTDGGQIWVRPSAPPAWLSDRALPKANELEIIRRLAGLGIRAEHAIAVFFTFRLVFAFILMTLPGLLFYRYGPGAGLLRAVGVGVVGGCVAWFLPQLIVSRLVRRRMKSIERGLPDAIELLCISVEAGLALEDAIDRVVPELWRAQPTMAEELALTSADLKILPSRDAALRRLSARVAVPSVHSVVTTLSQTLRYGTPLAQALRVVASELRNNSLIRLEEKANKMPVLLTIPMVLFILPSVFLIIGGPSALRLLDAFRQ
jgi:tight adherence protein C